MGILDILFSSQTPSGSAPTSNGEKQVVWQCRYCGLKNTRWQSNGMPDPGFCNKHGKMGGPKGPHRWVRIMIK